MTSRQLLRYLHLEASWPPRWCHYTRRTRPLHFRDIRRSLAIILSRSRSIEWYHFRRPWVTHKTPISKSLHNYKSNFLKTLSLSSLSLSYGQSYYSTLIGNHPVYRMIPLSMTFDWPLTEISSRDIFRHWISLLWRLTVAFAYLKVKSAKCLCLLPVVLVLRILSCLHHCGRHCQVDGRQPTKRSQDWDPVVELTTSGRLDQLPMSAISHLRQLRRSIIRRSRPGRVYGLTTAWPCPRTHLTKVSSPAASLRYNYVAFAPPLRLAASVLWCWSWEKEGRAVEVVSCVPLNWLLVLRILLIKIGSKG